VIISNIPIGARLSVIGTCGRFAKASSVAFAARVAALSLLRRRDTRPVRRFSSTGFSMVSAALSEPLDPPGGHDALEDECRLDLELAPTFMAVLVV